MSARVALFLLAPFLLSACTDPPQHVRIPFVAEFRGLPIRCGAGADTGLTDLRFYVYDVYLTDTSGEIWQVEFSADNNWQQANLALLDLEDGNCINGTSSTNDALQGSVAAGDYRALTFTLGVPFEQNHRDPLLAAAPLDEPAMHWHWRGGYKFLRAGIRTTDDGFWLHLGSTGCQGTLQNIVSCNASNRVSVELPNFVPGRDIVVVDLGELVTRPELGNGTASDCSSGPAEENCSVAFEALGLDHASGTNGGEQHLFSSRAKP